MDVKLVVTLREEHRLRIFESRLLKEYLNLEGGYEKKSVE
jgi:hypothetical protein